MNITDEKTSPIKAVIVKVIFGFMKPSKVTISLTLTANDSRYYATTAVNEVIQIKDYLSGAYSCFKLIAV
tara:strand:- start:60 stop:269 length:210 start_codon:yes stop_codon:yes gene_type:complete